MNGEEKNRRTYILKKENQHRILDDLKEPKREEIGEIIFISNTRLKTERRNNAYEIKKNR